MQLKQISVFLENKSGRLSRVTQILKEAKIVSMRREGTKNYYFMNTTDSQFEKLFDLLKHVTQIIKDVSDKENETCL